jgi:hypothetical protein
MKWQGRLATETPISALIAVVEGRVVGGAAGLRLSPAPAITAELIFEAGNVVGIGVIIGPNAPARLIRAPAIGSGLGADEGQEKRRRRDARPPWHG